MYICSSHYIEECSDFNAGNALRSASRFHKLDETALFGSACRHNIPLYFFNLKHGERNLKLHGISIAMSAID